MKADIAKFEELVRDNENLRRELKKATATISNLGQQNKSLGGTCGEYDQMFEGLLQAIAWHPDRKEYTICHKAVMANPALKHFHDAVIQTMEEKA